MSLRSKILLILVIVVTLYTVVDYTIQRLVVFPSFVELEHKEAKKDLERCVEALEREIQYLDTFNHDWAAWDDTYQFIEDRNEEYIASNLASETFSLNKVNLIYACGVDGRVVWGEIRQTDSWQKIKMKEFPDSSFPPEHPLLSHGSAEGGLAGIFSTETGPMLISSRPILKTTETGPSRGSLIMGRFLSGGWVDMLAEQTRVRLQLWPVAGNEMPEKERQVLKELIDRKSIIINSDKEDLLRVYKTYPDIRDEPALLMRVDVSREISAKGGSALQFALFSILLAGTVVMLVLFVLLQRTVVSPVEKLTAHVVAIGKSDDLSARLSHHRGDEIGTLLLEFDAMVKQLNDARKKLLGQSYRAGMAEMASGILHNIRNTLNPMIVDIDILRRDIEKAPIKEIKRAQAELGSGAPQAERARDLRRFVDLSISQLAALVQQMRTKLQTIANQARHIEEMLPDMTKLAHLKQSPDEVKLDELLDDAVALIPGNLCAILSVMVEPGVAEIDKIRTHRLSLLHVLANILVNAAEALEGAGLRAGQVTIRADLEQVDGSPMVHLQICDNGPGIETGILDRIFERDFTTKKGGSSGIGLHWCANILRAMNGQLYAESKGTGQGACFHVLLPANQ